MVRKVSGRLKIAPGATKKRKKTTDLSKLKKELWELCKQIIRKRYGNTCYTCDAHPLEGSNWHTGHFIAQSICGVYLKYDLRNLRPQCYRCNISLVGNGAVFYHRLLGELGPDYLSSLFADKERITKLTPQFLREKIEEYKAMIQPEAAPQQPPGSVSTSP